MQDLSLFLIAVGFLLILRDFFDKEVKMSDKTMDHLREYSKRNPNEVHLKNWLDKQ